MNDEPLRQPTIEEYTMIAHPVYEAILGGFYQLAES